MWLPVGPVPLPEPSAAVIPAQAKDPELCAKKWAEAEKAPGLWSLTLYDTVLISLQFSIKVCIACLPTYSFPPCRPRGSRCGCADITFEEEQEGRWSEGHLSPHALYPHPAHTRGQLMGISAPVSRVSPLEDQELEVISPT